MLRDWTELLSGRAIIDNTRMQTIERMTAQLQAGEIWECGVFRGGSALALSHLFPDRTLRLFDTFAGMPEVDPHRDLHQKGDFAETSLAQVSALLQLHAVQPERIRFYPGFWPDTFAGLGWCRIALLHLDGDLYKSNWDALSFVWPRLVEGGVIINDDYSLATCPGVKQAMDAYFLPLGISIQVVPETGQAVVIKEGTLAERYILNEAGQPAPYVPPAPPGRPAPPSEPEKPFQVGDRLQIAVTVRELIHRGGNHWNVRLTGADVDFWQPAERLEKIARRLPHHGHEEAGQAGEATWSEAEEPDGSAPDSRELKKARKRPTAHQAWLSPTETK